MSEKLDKKPVSDTEKEGNRELTPAEVVEHLSKLKQRYCKEFGEKTGAEIIFPKDTKIGDMDVSGQSLETVLNGFIARLESYEPPIVQKQFEADVVMEKEEVPLWLKGHEELVWNGAHDNPLWEVQPKQHKNEVTISYERRGMVLNPGRDKEEQGREVESLKNTFNLEEWKIIQKVLDDYLSLEKDLEGEDAEAKKKAKEQIFAIVKEENAYRNGTGEVPELLKKKIEEALEEVSKKTRGFKKESVDVEVLTQNTAEILSQLLVLNRTRGDGKDKIPEINPDIKEFPSFDLNMEHLVECMATQHAQSKGMALMLGEAGTGKNIAAEHFAANTNRPFHWFPCGRGMEAIDLVAHYEFTTEEGTKRFLTDLVRGIQTPGAVVMIDEVNSLKPEVQAMLHGLGDANRTLKYDGISIPVAEDVLIIIAGNPATYGSAGNLGEALLSRTRGQSMVMEYPALTKGELIAREEKWSKEFLEQREQEDNTLKDYACDEAVVLYGELNEFSGVNEEEFALLWDVVVNETSQGSKITEVEKNEKLAKLVTGPVGEHIKKILIDMRDMLRIADQWRKKFEKKAGGFDIVGVSMRDTIALMRAYKKERDVRKAYLTLIDDYKKNPIDGLEVTHAAAEQLINDVLGSTSAV
jgi:hypothetical protein